MNADIEAELWEGIWETFVYGGRARYGGYRVLNRAGDLFILPADRIRRIDAIAT